MKCEALNGNVLFVSYCLLKTCSDLYKKDLCFINDSVFEEYFSEMNVKRWIGEKKRRNWCFLSGLIKRKKLHISSEI